MMKDSRALGAPQGPDPREETTARRTTDRSAEEWAAILAGAGLVPAKTRSLGVDEPAVAWHHRDGALTPDGPAESGGTKEGAPSADTNRVDLRVDAADLGQLDIAIDRMDSGVRVTIQARDDRAVRALEPERLRILDVLTTTGVRVDSVTVVRSGTGSKAGIGLAQGTERAADESAPSRAAHRRRPQKKNHFVG